MAIWTAEQAEERLLPPHGNGHGLALVLFVSGAEKEAEAIEKFEHATSKSTFTTGVIDLEETSREVAAWFRLDAQKPTLAAILDGMVLAIEDESSHGSCQRAVRDALAQYRLFAGMDRVG